MGHTHTEKDASMSFSFRRDVLTRPIFAWAHKALPAMSDTEREALEAGDVWWDADLFSVNPDWSKLLANAPAKLTGGGRAGRAGPGGGRGAGGGGGGGN